MKLHTIERSDLSPKKQLLKLLSNPNDHFILLMSKEWFDEFERCKGVEEQENHYNSSSTDYQFFDVYEKSRWNSKVLKTIKVININGYWILVSHEYIPATKIYYFK